MASFKLGKFSLICSVIPVVLIFIILKVIVHTYGLEFLPTEVAAILPMTMTSIIFILGFLLAGTLGDFKESEKLPNDISTSAQLLWQEAFEIYKAKNNPTGAVIAHKVVEVLKEYKLALIKESFEPIQKRLTELLSDFISVQNDIAAPSMVRIKNEILVLKKALNRIKVIKETDFCPSVFFTVKLIVIGIFGMSLFLKYNVWWTGLVLTSLFSFIIFTIFYVISDLEDPFEYDEEDFTAEKKDKAESDEVCLDIIDDVISELEEMNETYIDSKPEE